MSLRPTLTALREPARSIRALSSTISLSVPLSPDQTSSTASLLSLNKPKPRGSGTRYDPQRVNTASALLDKFKNRGARNVKSQQADFNRMNEQKLSGQYLREMPRRWQVGDVYSPHDLSPVEMDKWRRKNARQGDVIDALGLKPLDMYKNFSILAEFTKSSGQIMHSEETGLRPVNQRKIAKMIRRAQGMGIYPSVHDHPEMIRDNFFSNTRRYER